MKPLVAVLASVACIVLSGCSTTPATNGPGPVPTPSDPVDRSNIRELDRIVDERLFQIEELPFSAEEGKPPIVAIGYRLQQACKTELATDSRIVTETSAKWQSLNKDFVVDQTVIAYDRPVGRKARDEANAALTCETYTQLDRVFDQIQRVDVGDASALSFCERVRPDQRAGGTTAWLCTVIVGADDLACSVRAWADDQHKALATVKTLTPLISKKCRRD